MGEVSMQKTPSIMMNMIAAVSGPKMGIGKNNTLPWHLPQEYKYFVRHTKSTSDPSKKNAVIMGRLCWESIPEKFLPLKDRLNVVLSRTLEKPPAENVYLCRSLEEAVELLTETKLRDSIETIWNVGGREVYAAGLRHPLSHKLYLTRIKDEIDCDVFFPSVDWDKFTEVQIDNQTDCGVHEENGFSYTFHVYEKIAG